MPSGNIEDWGDNGEMGECKTHPAEGDVGLPGGSSSGSVSGGSAFRGGSVKSCTTISNELNIEGSAGA